jgi:sugar phosphate isomerase/epimerase
LGPALGAAPTPFSFRWILASSLYGTLPVEQILAQVPKTAAAEIDLWPKHHADQREQVEAMGHDRFAELLARYKVRLGMTTRYDLGPFKLQEEFKFLQRFGGRLIVTGAVGPKDLSGPECRRAVAQFVEQMKPHVAAAEEHGITIGIENHIHSLINTPDSIRYLGELSPSPRLGVALAPYHLSQDERLLAGLVEDLGPKLVHFYAWQFGEGCTRPMPKPLELKQMPGRGALKFRPMVAALAKIGYTGWSEVFMHPTPRGIPILPTLAEVTTEVNRARSYMEQLAAGS